MKNILIIEDDADTVILMREIFEMSGCEVREASDRDEAISELSQDVKFDLIVTDYNVPGFAPNENIVSTLKDSYSIAPEKICIVSGDANLKEIASSQGVKALLKPVSLTDLTNLLN